MTEPLMIRADSLPAMLERSIGKVLSARSGTETLDGAKAVCWDVREAFGEELRQINPNRVYPIGVEA